MEFHEFVVNSGGVLFLMCLFLWGLVASKKKSAL